MYKERSEKGAVVGGEEVFEPHSEVKIEIVVSVAYGVAWVLHGFCMGVVVMLHGVLQSFAWVLHGVLHGFCMGVVVVLHGYCCGIVHVKFRFTSS